MIDAMHLIKPGKGRLTWTPRITLTDGRKVKIPGSRDRDTALKIGNRAEMLVADKAAGDPPRATLLGWIDSMSDELFNRLVDLELLEPRRRLQSLPIAKHLDEFEKAIASRRSNTTEHARRQAANVRRVFDALNITKYHEINQHDVLTKVRDWGLADATRRHYLVAVCDFCKWMVRQKRAGENPMLNTPMPRLGVDEKIQRRPMTPDEFRRLVRYLDQLQAEGGRYHKQYAQWTAHDRKMIYWTAVCTGYRQNELRQMTVAKLFLDESPATIDINARDAKNRTAASVPIPPELAEALRTYIQGKLPAARVFPIPTSRHNIIDIFRADLKAAGIDEQWETGERLDFHALRTTAICWWLDECGLPAKRVQILARLKTLALVESYSRKLRLSSDVSWLDKAPRVEQEKQQKKGGQSA